MSTNIIIDWTELSIQWMLTCGHFLWQGFVVAVALLVAERLALKRASTRYAAACAALFSLPVCVLLTFSVVHNSRGSIAKAHKASTESVVRPSDVLMTSKPGTELDHLLDKPSNEALLPRSSTIADEIVEASVDAAEPSASSGQRMRFLAATLSVIYAIVVSLLLLRMSLCIIGSFRLRSSAQPVTDPQLLQVIVAHATRLRLKVTPIVAVCVRVSSPVVVGIVRPMILLPPSLLCGLDPIQLAAILSHEMAHIRRYDLFINLLQRVIEALFFFHPITWWISRRVTMERESCCDDVAASHVGRLTYAEALLQMASICLANHRSRSEALAMLAADGGNSTDFGYRIRRLIDAQQTPQIGFTKRSFAFCCATIALLSASLMSLGQVPQTKKDESQLNRSSKDTLIDAVGQPDIDPRAARLLDEATDKSILWGEPSGGMRLGIRQSEYSRRHPVLRHGELIDYEVWIKNETDEVIQIERDPRNLQDPRLMDDQSINVIGSRGWMSFNIPPMELAKAELILPPGQSARRFLYHQHSASIGPPGSPRGRFGSEPLHLEPGKYPVYAQLGELKSGVDEVEIIPAARLQVRKAGRVTEKKREYAAKDPSEAILAWQTVGGEKQEVMFNLYGGIFIDERDLASVDLIPVKDQPDQSSIAVRLKPESSRELARRIESYSLWEDPTMVAMLFDGKLLGAVNISSPIPDDTLALPSLLPRQQAGAIVNEIRSAIAQAEQKAIGQK